MTDASNPKRPERAPSALRAPAHPARRLWPLKQPSCSPASPPNPPAYRAPPDRRNRVQPRPARRDFGSHHGRGTVPGFARPAALLSISKLGPVTAAVFLGSIGDPRAYDSSRQALKVAGLSLVVSESGMQRGNPRLSKRGRPELRRQAYLFAVRSVRRGGLFRADYERALAANPPHAEEEDPGGGRAQGGPPHVLARTRAAPLQRGTAALARGNNAHGRAG